MPKTRLCTAAMFGGMLVLVGLSGCVKPYLKVTDQRGDLKSSQTLLAAAVFDNTRPSAKEERTSLDVVLKVASNINLDAVGQHMLKDAETMLSEYGLVLKRDQAQARKIDFFKGAGVPTVSKVVQALTGRWVSPDGAQMRSIGDTTWLFESVRVGMAKALDSKTPNEHFLFVSARGTADREWLIFVRPEVVLYYLVLNERGDIVLEARGIGHGEKSFFTEDQAPANLILALQKASENMRSQPVEPLK